MRIKLFDIILACTDFCDTPANKAKRNVVGHTNLSKRTLLSYAKPSDTQVSLDETLRETPPPSLLEAL